MCSRSIPNMEFQETVTCLLLIGFGRIRHGNLDSYHFLPRNQIQIVFFSHVFDLLSVSWKYVSYLVRKAISKSTSIYIYIYIHHI